MSEKGANVQRKTLKLQKTQWTVAINVENLQESLALSLERKYKETRVARMCFEFLVHQPPQQEGLIAVVQKSSQTRLGNSLDSLFIRLISIP